MKATIAALTLSLFTFSAHANLATAKFLVFSLSPFITSADVSFALSRTSGCTAPHCAPYAKIVQAKDDAQAFIATDGEIRGARLEAAFEVIRAYDPAAQVTDLELAIAIVSL